MSLTTAQQVRLRIQDQPLIADVIRYGDGSASAFQLEHRNITSGTAFVPGAGGWTATGATFDPTGCVVFDGVISANSGCRFRYVHSTFGEDEIGHFTAVGGSVRGAALEAVRTLMFDSLKRASWAAPDNTRFDDTAALEQLRALYDRLRAEIAEDEIAAGDYAAWSEGQEEW
jgi:hypothetical protein